MLLPPDNVGKFAEHVRAAPTDPHSERVVRLMIEGVATSCSMPVLIRLAECLIDCRKDEMREDVRKN